MQIAQGDTKDLKISITKNGEPFIPTKEKIVFSVKKSFGSEDPILIQREVKNGMVKILHEDTADLEFGDYVFDVRIFDTEKSIVSTPIIGTLKVTKVVNNGI